MSIRLICTVSNLGPKDLYEYQSTEQNRSYRNVDKTNSILVEVEI